jgi:thiol-disulfide isomerase/thioredoxin
VLAEWCGHCQRAKPELAAAADRLGGAVPVLGLDADAAPGIVEEWGVQGGCGRAVIRTYIMGHAGVRPLAVAPAEIAINQICQSNQKENRHSK